MRYWAFISYSWADRPVGERFQRAIEHYRVPKSLRGTDHGHGPTPKHLTPLFRDRSDGDAGADLGSALQGALEASDALIVLCSNVSRKSKWVNEEIRTFKRLGRSHRIFPVVIEGEPKRFDPVLSPDGVFPPALFEVYDAKGELVASDAPEPLAPDIRESGDGFRFAQLKVVAGITGISLTVLTDRQREAERRERLIARAIAGGMTALALLASVAAVLAWQSENAAQERLHNAIEMAARRVDDAATFQDQYGMPSDIVAKLLEGAEKDFDSLIGAADGGQPVMGLETGRMMVLFSGLNGAVGDGDKQLQLAKDALARLEGIPDSRQFLKPETWFARLPDRERLNAERLQAIDALGLAYSYRDDGAADAVATFERGRKLAEETGDGVMAARFLSHIAYQHYSSGKLPEAMSAYDGALKQLKGISDAPGEQKEAARQEQALVLTDHAEMLLEMEKSAEAFDEQKRATQLWADAVKAAPDDDYLKSLYAQALVRQADMRYAVTGKWDDSFSEFDLGVTLFREISERDPMRIDYARYLMVAIEHQGDALFQEKKFGDAKNLFDESLRISRTLVERNPRSIDAQRDLAVALEKAADSALVLKDIPAALKHIDEARRIRTVAAGLDDDARDPVDVRDLAMAWNRTGMIRAAGKLEDWRGAFETAIADMKALVLADGSAPGWMRDLSVFYAAYGAALSEAGDKAGAVAQWREALSWTKRQQEISKTDPRLAEAAKILAKQIETGRVIEP